MKPDSAWENGEIVPVVEPDDIADGQQLTSMDGGYTVEDYRMLYSKLIRWAVSANKDGSYLRLLVLGLYLCPAEWNNPSQRTMAAMHGVSVQSLNKIVMDFEKRFKVHLPCFRGPDARAHYRASAIEHHKKRKMC